jgi:hypothetical protein
MKKPLARLMLGLALAHAGTAHGASQGPASQPLATQLVTAMTDAGLEAIAARDPRDPSRAIAALSFPGSQLLVIAAPYPDAAELDSKLTNRLYRDVYSALQQPSISTGKVFFQDLGCDGLRAAGDGAVDVMYEDGKTQTIFDGNWKKQKLSETAYLQRAKEADARYAHLLEALIEAARKNRR